MYFFRRNKEPKKEKWREQLEPPIMESNPLRMFVRSVDTLLGNPIDETLPGGREWPTKPPIIVKSGSESTDVRRYKKLCRNGIPSALRSAIWITSVVTKSRPYQSREETEDFGTLKKVEILDHGWEMVRKSLFPDISDEESCTIPDFGLDPKEMEGLLVTDHFFFHLDGKHEELQGNLTAKAVKGVHMITMFLYAARENLGIEYCPLLPDMTALLLSHMPVSYAYAAIREMANTEDYFFPMSKVEHFSWCKTFGDLMRKMYPQTARVMSNCGAMTPDGLDPIFRRFFVTILKREHVLRILDIYFIEGYKAIFRLGTVILCLCTFYLTPEETISADAFWSGVKRVTHSSVFHFDVLIKQSYGFNGKRYRTSRTFPRRRFIQRLMGYNNEWASRVSSDHVLELTEKPLGFVEDELPIVLAKNASERLKLSEFLPFSYKSTKIDLIYSTNVQGRSLQMFYKHCAKAKHTIVLIEILNNGATIGMFATDTWRNNPKMYGDGNCFLFRLKPDPVAFHWRHESALPKSTVPESPLHPNGATNEGNESDHGMGKIRSEGLNGQFMISRNNFISLGNNEDGSSGLRLNEDLSKGSSSKARGFNNEPLAGAEYPEFDVGLVEVYQLVREIDGRAIDGEEDVWKGMFD
jgi:hypothetical protein